jgi:phosphoribosyl 1,2-cyclic phosphodiesterase
MDKLEFCFQDLFIRLIKTSHDVADSVGYVIEGNGSSIVYITDTGYINQKYFPLLENREVYILESNHDIELLNHSSYSFQLRQRILGDKGHLSNYDCSRYLSSFIGAKTKYIVLAHLSEENNTSELAYDTLMERLEENKQSVEHILIAKQDEEIEEILV